MMLKCGKLVDFFFQRYTYTQFTQNIKIVNSEEFFPAYYFINQKYKNPNKKKN